MFCSVCGAESPHESQFCRMCGDRFLLSSTFDSKAAKTKAARAVCMSAGLLLLAGLGYYANAAHWMRRQTYSANLLDRLIKRPHNIPVSSQPVTINQLAYTYFKLDVPPKASSVILKGNFIATGGVGNTIEALIFAEPDYANWQNRQAASPLYSSGKVTMGEIDTELPAGAGRYYLVFNNKFSMVDAKTVRVNAALTYYQ